MTTFIGSDPVDVIIFGVLLAIGLIRLVLWLIAPPRWQDLETSNKSSGDPFLYFLSGSTRHH